MDERKKEKETTSSLTANFGILATSSLAQSKNQSKKLMILSICALWVVFFTWATAFNLMRQERAVTRLLPLASSLEDFLLDDPYADLLNFSQPVEEEASKVVKEESSIASVSGPLVHFATISAQSKEQQYWSELPIIPLHKEEEETAHEKASRERWLSEVKSLIERQRGTYPVSTALLSLTLTCAGYSRKSHLVGQIREGY